MNKKVNAYRAIFSKDEEAYQTNPSILPNLSGSYFNSYEGYTNNCTYLPDVQYLHFFPTKSEAILYAKSLKETTGNDVSVGLFSFDDELLKSLTFTGKYLATNNMLKVIDREEYIIPLSYYKPSENLVGFIPHDELDKQIKPEPYDPDGYMSGWFK